MKAIASFFLTGIVMMFLICGITSCMARSQEKEDSKNYKELQVKYKELNSDYDTLQKENSSLKTELAIKDLQLSSYEHDNSTNTQIVTLYSTMFSPDPEGKLYTADSNQLWFTNPYCNENDLVKAEDIILLSDTIIEWKLPNGNIVYTCRTNKNEIVYTTTRPYLYLFEK